MHYSYAKIERKRYVILETAALATLAAVLGTAAVGYSAYSGVAAMAGGGKKKEGAPAITPPSTPPSPVDADALAKEDLANKRRMRLLSGGKTLLADETLGGGGVAQKTLLGS